MVMMMMMMMTIKKISLIFGPMRYIKLNDTMFNALERKWKKAVVFRFELLSVYFLNVLKIHYKKPQGQLFIFWPKSETGAS
jgi:hypothetical protein